jgi:hypothetical protein
MSSIASGTTSTTALVYTADTSGVLQLQTNGTTTALTIDTSQNVGIGTTSPSNKVSIVTTSGSDGFLSITSPSTDTAGILINGGSSSNKGALVTLQKAGTTKWRIGLDSAIGGGTNNNLNIYGSSTDALVFSPNATERMRLDSSGNLLVGNTSLPSSSGATSGVINQTGGIWTNRGQITSGGSSTTTMVTLSNVSNNQTYLISAKQAGGGSNFVLAFVSAYGSGMGVARIIQDNTNPSLDMNITGSGLSLQLVLASGFGLTTWDWVLTRLG